MNSPLLTGSTNASSHYLRLLGECTGRNHRLLEARETDIAIFQFGAHLEIVEANHDVHSGLVICTGRTQQPV